MATPAHCLYCFEVLSAAFQDRDPSSLAEVEALWKEYRRGEHDDEVDADAEAEHPSMTDTAGGDTASGLEEQDDEGEDDEEDLVAADETSDSDDAVPAKPAKNSRAHSLSQALAHRRSGRTTSTTNSSSTQQQQRKGGALPISRLLNVPSPARTSNSNSPASTRNSSTPSLQSSSNDVSSSRSTPNTQPSPSASASDLSVQDDHPSRKSTKSKTPSASPMFVTWNTVTRSGGRQLRGCIGTFDPLELEKGLRTYATTSYVPPRTSY